LGDDAVKASTLGIANLKRILPKLLEWSAEDGKDYQDLRELYGQVFSQINRYVGHVASNVGGVYQYTKTSDQEGTIFQHVPKEQQQKAVQFLNQQIFATPEWLINPAILDRIESTGIVTRLTKMHERALTIVFEPARLQRLIEAEATETNSVYTVMNLFDELEAGIWSELRSGQKITVYRRNLQRSYIDKLITMLDNKKDASDIRALSRSRLKGLERQIKQALSSQTDSLSVVHLRDILDRIEMVFYPVRQ
jgi:hypothetical protein